MPSAEQALGFPVGVMTSDDRAGATVAPSRDWAVLPVAISKVSVLSHRSPSEA